MPPLRLLATYLKSCLTTQNLLPTALIIPPIHCVYANAVKMAWSKIIDLSIVRVTKIDLVFFVRNRPSLIMGQKLDTYVTRNIQGNIIGMGERGGEEATAPQC